MSLNDSRIALYTYITNNFTAAEVAFRGDDQRADALDNGADPWIFIDLDWGDEAQRSMPSPKAAFSRAGLIAAKLYVRKEDGDAVLDQIADTYSNVMRAKQIGNITTTVVNFGPLQTTEKWTVRHITVELRVLNTYTIIPV